MIRNPREKSKVKWGFLRDSFRKRLCPSAFARSRTFSAGPPALHGTATWSLKSTLVWNRLWNRYETGMKPGMKPAHQTTGMKPSPKTIFVGSRSETGYETGYENDLFEAGLKPGMKPQNSNQGFSGFLAGGAPQATWCGVLDQHRITIMLTPSSLQTMGRATAMKPRLKRQVCNWQV